MPSYDFKFLDSMVYRDCLNLGLFTLENNFLTQGDSILKLWCSNPDGSIQQEEKMYQVLKAVLWSGECCASFGSIKLIEANLKSLHAIDWSIFTVLIVDWMKHQIWTAGSIFFITLFTLVAEHLERNSTYFTGKWCQTQKLH